MFIPIVNVFKGKDVRLPKKINMAGSQLFATSWLGLGFAETPITADKRLRYASPKLPSVTSFIRRTLYAMPCLREMIKNELTLT